jgi:predicted secreted protein
MTVTAALVLFAVVWSMVFFIVLPLGLRTQGDAGEIVQGTHASSPHVFPLKRKALVTTAWAVGIWCFLAFMVVWGPWGVRDLDWFGRMSPPREASE